MGVWKLRLRGKTTSARAGTRLTQPLSHEPAICTHAIANHHHYRPAGWIHTSRCAKPLWTSRLVSQVFRWCNRSRFQAMFRSIFEYETTKSGLFSLLECQH